VIKFFFYNHQHKADPLIKALESAGWRQLPPARARIIFVDTDYGTMRKTIKKHERMGQKIFIYPHAARVSLFNDTNPNPPMDCIAANFVTAPGHKEVLERLDYPRPVEVIGWYLCPMKPFEPRAEAKKILFAPIHPNADGSLSDVDKTINASTFRRLLLLVEAGAISLKVRYLRKLEQNGLWVAEGVEYIEGQPDQSYAEIDAADLVVSHQTFAYIAIARGVPTVMMGEGHAPRFGSPERGNFQLAKSFDRYKDLLMYPFDILGEMDTQALFRRAVHSDVEIADWRARHIGEPFDAGWFVKAVEKYL
jgi:hypothetical protein